jgi:hypothetical protein
MEILEKEKAGERKQVNGQNAETKVCELRTQLVESGDLGEVPDFTSTER